MGVHNFLIHSLFTSRNFLFVRKFLYNHTVFRARLEFAHMGILNKFLGCVIVLAAIGLIYFVMKYNYAGDVAYKIPIDLETSEQSPNVLAYLARNQSRQTLAGRQIVKGNDRQLREGLTDWFTLSPDMQTVRVRLLLKHVASKQSASLLSRYSRQTVVQLIDENDTVLVQKDNFHRPESKSDSGVSSSARYKVGDADIDREGRYRLYYRINPSLFSGLRNSAYFEVRRNVTYPNTWILIISGGCFVVSAGLLIILHSNSSQSSRA